MTTLDVNIFDLADLSETQLESLVGETLTAFPSLRTIYDHVFVRELIKDNLNWDNYLLLLLVRVNDERASEFWNSTINDLMLLADRDAWALFKNKLRKRSYYDIESAKSELTLAAWMERSGCSVVLEPRVNGTRLCEFVAKTVPETWWEVKSPGDVRIVRTNNRIELELQGALRRIPELYVLSVSLPDENVIRFGDLPRTIKNIKRKITEFYRKNGEPPHTIASDGLKVLITSRVKKLDHGFVGTFDHGYLFEDEYRKLVLKRISVSIGQIPKNGAGIVVIDATATTWLTENDVVEACFGRECYFATPDGGLVEARTGASAFQEKVRRRISGVVYYTRAPRHLEGCGFEMVVLHNPFARVPLPTDTLRFPGVAQKVCEPMGNDRYRLVTVAS